jgi:BMFP domain-containing protein YqiC
MADRRTRPTARTLLIGRPREAESVKEQLARIARLDFGNVAYDARDAVARLEARVEELERRLAALESERR